MGTQSDEHEAQDAETVDKPAEANANPGGADTGETGGGGFKPITSESELSAWKEGTRRHLLTEAKRQADADAKRRMDEEAAKAKGEWERLANERQAEIDRLGAEVAKRDLDALRARIAAKHKLEHLTARIQGETEAEMDADAKELAKHVKPIGATNTEAGAGGARGPKALPPDRAGAVSTGGKAYTFLPDNAVRIPD